MAHEIIQLKVEEHDNFIYIIADRATGEAAVVDPAWDAEGIREVLQEEALQLTAILITHVHHDHINAVEALRRPETAIFVTEKEYARWENAPADAILIGDGEEIMLGSASIQVLLTAGHTAGSCCFLTGKNLLVGDTVFVYGCGNVKDASASAEALFHSLQRLKTLPSDTQIWCGHDYGIAESSTLGEQMQGNPFFMIERQEDFILYREQIASRSRKTPYAAISKEALQEALQNHL